MPTFRSLVPMLWVKDLASTISYYQNILGFTCGERNDEWGWAALHRDTVEIMLAIPRHNQEFKESAYTGSFYIYTEAVDELWEQFKDKVEVVYEPANFEYGMRDFGILDCNGFMLQFGRNLRDGEIVEPYD